MQTPAIEVEATSEHMLGMPVATFLRDYWQKRPLLIRQAFPDFVLPLEPDDLGGLGLEENALARLIEYDRPHDDWKVHHAPLDEALFQRLPDRDWTLLVQDVDKWDADVATLLDHFGFLPGWRIDDVMISYAEDQGGVGAHVDQYDVFLLQGMGKRRWSIDARPNPPTAFRENVELKLLQRFSPNHAWTLEPGDMLYLPPGVPHDGVADGPCMTFSIGMRAPSKAELMLDFSEFLAESMPEDARYADPDLTEAMHDGLIDETALARVRRSLGAMAGNSDDAVLGYWFGRFITRYRTAQVVAPPSAGIDRAGLMAILAAHPVLLRHPWTRMAWIREPDDRANATLFAGGEPLPCPATLAELLCGHRRLTFTTMPGAAELDVLLELVNAGHLLPENNA